MKSPWVLLAGLTLLACGSRSPAEAPDATTDPRADQTAGEAATQCPPAPQSGQACDGEDLRCFGPGAASTGCGEQLTICSCTAGSFRCVDVSVGAAACAAGQLPEGLRCAREGTPTCDVPPTGGSCSCDNGQWSCELICPEWCPSWPPAEGETVSCPADAEGIRCPYSDPPCCTCSEGKLDCRAAAC